MNEDRLSKLLSLYGLENHSKEMFGQTFENRQELFLDAFQYGIYHEESADWAGVAAALSVNRLLSLALAAFRTMIASSVENRDGERLATIMEMYEALDKWRNGHLEQPSEILDVLERFRALLFKSAIEEMPSAWWGDTIRAFSLVEFGIRVRMGLACHELDSEYDRVLSKVAGEKR